MSEVTATDVGVKKALVVGVSGVNTLKVMIERKVKHPLYGKFVRRSTKFLVHNEIDGVGKGDFVMIKEGAPKSKRKSWYVAGVDKV